MKVHPSLLARLAVYATALVVVATVHLPDQSAQSAIAALRTTQSESSLDPARIIIAGILLIGICLEVAYRRAIWH